jgi:hypothetical protein
MGAASPVRARCLPAEKEVTTMNHNRQINQFVSTTNPLAAQHTTREGKTMLIGQMTDSHLINQIKLLCSKIGQAKAAARGCAQFDIYTARLYGVQLIDAEQAADVVGQLAGRLLPFVFEAVLRGLQEDIRPLLTAAFERDAALPGELPALPSPGELMGDDDPDLNDLPF